MPSELLDIDLLQAELDNELAILILEKNKKTQMFKWLKF